MKTLFRILFVVSVMIGMQASLVFAQSKAVKDTKAPAGKTAPADKDMQKPVGSATDKPAESPEAKDPLQYFRFRNLGPAVGGGRVTSVVGVPGKPNIYYAGAAGGGVFATQDGGLTWRPIFEKESTASIGAIALAPSNPNLIWVGTGEKNIRNDVVTGKGIFF